MALEHAEAGEVIDLRPLGPALNETKTAAIVKSTQFEAIRLIVPAGQEIPVHKVPGELTMHCLEGAVRINLSQAQPVLNAGDWIFLKGHEPHSLTGVEDASVLLTIILPADR